jgi:hypothetical protein
MTLRWFVVLQSLASIFRGRRDKHGFFNSLHAITRKLCGGNGDEVVPDD